jgi:hypothetical protein
MEYNDFRLNYGDRIEATDVVFFIPYRKDCSERSWNLAHQLKYLCRIVNKPHIFVYEVDEHPSLTIEHFEAFTKQTGSEFFIMLKNYYSSEDFHKTKYLNEMLLHTMDRAPDKKYACILDYDVLLYPDMYKRAIYKIRTNTVGMVYPFSAMVMLSQTQSEIVRAADLSELTSFDCAVNVQHPGGIQLISIEALNRVRGWNEQIYLGGEDIELYFRINKLYGSDRFGGVAFHLYHPNAKWLESDRYKDGADVVGQVSKIDTIKEMQNYISTMNGIKQSVKN